jgi:hypothetical protein
MACTNGFCWLQIGPATGQHTNGPCNCLRDIPLALRQEIKAKLTHQQGEITRLTAERDDREAAARWYHTEADVDVGDAITAAARWPWLEETDTEEETR